jgi:hypothetical protein
MKYLYREGDLIKVEETVGAFNVAMEILSGVDYAKFDIDPIEASVLVSFVRVSAMARGDAKLIESCNNILSKLSVQVQAYIVLLEYTT